jgi:methylene-fatty-acyl-phospholipid synthase
MSSLLSYVDTSKPSLWIALLAIAFNPTAWNIVARHEYRNKNITRMFGGHARYGCYFLAVMIFSCGLVRDGLFHQALADQPHTPIFPEPYASSIAIALFLIGQLFVVTSTWALGITGTFLGDYFGILMDHRVEGFPFNVLNDPMYVGSTMCFAATALWNESPVGLFITLYVYIVYVIALRFEGPFTDAIYSKRASVAAAATKKDS